MDLSEGIARQRNGNQGLTGDVLVMVNFLV